MNAVYISTNGDTVTTLATPLDIPNYGCGVIELSGRIDDQDIEISGKVMDMINLEEEEEEVEDQEDGIGLRKRKRDMNGVESKKRKKRHIKEKNQDDLYLCSDIVVSSYVHSIKLPVLRCIKRKPNGYILNNISRPIWLSLNRPFISNIRLYITNNQGEIISLPNKSLNCTVLFLPNPI